MSATSSQSLEGAVVLVTGARGGIGRAICCAMKEAGALVVATSRSSAASDVCADAWLRHDVTSAADWTSVLNGVTHRYGRVDCLVNNAALSLVEKISDTTLEQWRSLWSVNVEGVLLGLQVALPLLCASGKDRVGGSSVVNVSSTAGRRGVPFNAAYSASKGAVTVFSQAAAREFAQLGYPIRVNSVHPADVDTPMMDSILARYVQLGLATSVQEEKLAWGANMPLRRMARPEEIAGSVVFLCSPASAYVTGSQLVIDGGLCL